MATMMTISDNMRGCSAMVAVIPTMEHTYNSAGYDVTFYDGDDDHHHHAVTHKCFVAMGMLWSLLFNRLAASTISQ